MRESCIANFFQHYAPLGPQEIRFLDSLEQKPVFYPRNSMVWHEGSDASNFFVLCSGWAYSSRILTNGSRQALEVFVPGDVIGLHEYAYIRRLNTLHAITDLELCVIPKKRLQDAFKASAVLGQLFFALSTQSQTLLLERVINLGRRSARQRVAHLFTELWLRAGRHPNADSERVLPLSQTLLADLLGLSAVHINRTMRGLREDGLIELQPPAIKLLDMDGLREVSGFNPAYLANEFLSQLHDGYQAGSPPVADDTTTDTNLHRDPSLT